MPNMKSILLIWIYATLVFASQSETTSIWKQLLAPNNPVLLRVRNLNEAGLLKNIAILDFVGQVQQYSYPAEEHMVTTEDGYHLILHRIPYSPRNKDVNNKRIAFLQHGILSSSDLWINEGPEQDLPFILADQGYDVWLGNSRGNTYCRSHRNLSTSDQRFWQFSFHEIGIYDIPSMVDYVLNYTKQKKLYYVGYSMGSTLSYVLLSMKPEYNAKFHLLVNFAPVAFWNYGGPSSLVKIIENNEPVQEFFESNDIHDIGSLSIINVKIGRTICSNTSPLQSLCESLLFVMFGNDPDGFNKTVLPHFFSYYPAGSSINTLRHYLQNILAKKFQLYDYGVNANRFLYKQDIPPLYNLQNVTAPFGIFYGTKDSVLCSENAKEVIKHLPNVVASQEVPYNHIGFFIAENRRMLIYDKLLQLMDRLYS